MGLDANWVAAIASAISAFVLLATVIAAFAQIRQMRNANEIPLYLRLYERLDAAQTGDTFGEIESLAARIRSEPELRYRLAHELRMPEFATIWRLVQFFEHLSTLVAVGGMSERLILAEYAENIVRTWDLVAEAVYLRRNVLSPYTGAAFEHLAMRAKRYIDDGELRELYRKLERDPKMSGFTPPAAPSPDGSSAPNNLGASDAL